VGGVLKHKYEKGGSLIPSYSASIWPPPILIIYNIAEDSNNARMPGTVRKWYNQCNSVFNFEKHIGVHAVTVWLACWTIVHMVLYSIFL